MRKILLSLSVITFTSIIIWGNSALASTTVSIEDAEIVLQKFTPTTDLIGEWNDKQLVSIFLDTDDSELGYYFELFNEEEYVGYVLVSATTDREPIIMHGDGMLLVEEPEENEDIYYFGAFNYAIVEEGQTLDEALEEIKNESIEEIIAENENYQDMKSIDLSNIDEKTQEQFSINALTGEEHNTLEEDSIETIIEDLNNMEFESYPKSPGKYNNEWDALLSDEEVFSIAATSKTLAVTRVYQRLSGVNNPKSSCGPAVGVMVNNYYKSRGAWVKKGSDYGGNAKFINRLYGMMNSGVLGTSANGYRDGVRAQLNVNHSTSTRPFNTYIFGAPNNQGTYKAHIDTNDPVAIRFNNYVRGSSAYNWHFIIGIGYNGNNVIVKDPDGKPENTGSHSFSYTSNQSKMSLIFHNPRN